MKVFGRSISLAAIAVLASVAVAGAATPKLGGTYVGSSASHKRLKITVSRDGKTGKLTYCGYTVGIHIVRDHFGVHKKIADGQVSVFRIYGSWKTKQLVSGKIDLDFGCDGRPGNWSATLK
jgi:hypothetical protein